MGRPADSRRLPICRIWSLDGDRRCCSWLLASDFSCCSWSRLQLGPIAYPYGSNAAGRRSPSCSWSSFPGPCFCGCGWSFLWNCSWSPLAGHCFCGRGRFFVWSHCGTTRSRKKNCSGILQQVAEGRLSCTSHRPLKPNKIHTLQ